MAFLTEEQLKSIGFKHLGKNVSLSDKTSIYNPHLISIGDNTRIDDFCILSSTGEGIEIGNHVHIACYVSIIGKAFIQIQDFCGISARTSIYSSNDDYSGNFLTGPTIPETFKNVYHAPVIIGKHVIIGAGSIVLPGITIGVGSAIGSLSLVNKDCEEFYIYVGVPAKKFKQRSNQIIESEKRFLNNSNQ